MSGHPLSKLDIDVLVQLGLEGPTGADAWYPFAYREDARRMVPAAAAGLADEIGTTLWRVNCEATLDEEELGELVLSYVFERVPCPLTAAEGIKQAHNYVYQSHADGHDWDVSEPNRLCLWLISELARAIPGYDEAPWGWQPSDVDARVGSGQTAAPDASSAESDGLLPEDIRRRLADIGIELETVVGTPDDEPSDFARLGFLQRPRLKVAEWMANPRRAHLAVRLYASPENAEHAFAARRALHERTTIRGSLLGGDDTLVWVAQQGGIVIDYQGAKSGCSDGREVLMALGPLDRHWSSDELGMTEITGAAVLVRSLSLPNGSNPGVVLARDPAGLERIAEHVRDAADRARVLAVDTAEQMALLLIGVTDTASVEGGRLFEVAAPVGMPPRYVLELDTNGARWLAGTVIVLDKPAERPVEIVVRDGVRRGRRGKVLPTYVDS